MNDKKRLLISTIISLIGDQMTQIVLATLLFQLTGSGELVASIIIFRTFGVFLSGFIVPAMISKINNRKQALVYLDLSRAALIFLIIILGNTYLVFFTAFLSAILSGAFYPIKQSAVQQLLKEDARFKFITLEQTFKYLIIFIVPALAGVAASMFNIKYLLLIDSLTFVLSALFLFKLTPWEETKKTDSNVFQRAFSGYKIILSNKTQSTILNFRLILLFALTAYEILSIIVITKFSESCNIPGFNGQCDFSVLYGILLSVNGATFVIVNLISGKLASSDSFTKFAVPGVLLLGSGLLLWSIPVTLSYSWFVYLLAAILLSTGVGLCRIFVYNSGYKLTEKSTFVEVVSSSDAIARLWQSFVSFSVIGLSGLLPVSYVVIIGGILSAIAIFPARTIIATLQPGESKQDVIS